MRYILLVLALVVFTQSPAHAGSLLDRAWQMAQVDTGGVKVTPVTPKAATGVNPPGSIGIAQPNSCGSTDRCVPPKGGSCECHCEGTASKCTFTYGKGGVPKK